MSSHVVPFAATTRGSWFNMMKQNLPHTFDTNEKLILSYSPCRVHSPGRGNCTRSIACATPTRRQYASELDSCHLYLEQSLPSFSGFVLRGVINKCRRCKQVEVDGGGSHHPAIDVGQPSVGITSSFKSSQLGMCPAKFGAASIGL
jgi:hypothetical protein